MENRDRTRSGSVDQRNPTGARRRRTLGPDPSGPAAFPDEECKPLRPAAEARHPHLRQPGPPSPGPGTWRRAAPAASRGRNGLCRRRAPARAASRGLGRPGHPPRQGTRRARPALATGGSAYRSDRHPRAWTPSSAEPAPSSPPGAAYPAQARQGRRGGARARPEGRGRGRSWWAGSARDWRRGLCGWRRDPPVLELL